MHTARRIMLERVDQKPILHALRSHVALEEDVSVALTALHSREGTGLADLMNEARDLVRQLTPPTAGSGTRLDLESWLRTMLRGPHDGAWFDTRVECGRQGWTEIPPLASAVLMARLRHRLTEMAIACHSPTEGMGGRVANALGRLFDLEMAIIILDVDVGASVATGDREIGSARSAEREAVLAMGNALAVIDTSVYLIGRYFGQASPPRSDIERHLDRIAEHVLRAKKELGQFLRALGGIGPLMH